MLTTGFLLLSLVSVVTSYVNDFDKPLLFQCPRGQSIASWESYHSNHHEDRRHRFTCKRTPRLGGCQWYGYLNHFDQEISFQCPKNGVISGVNSFHSNHHEDRQFKFYCCSVRYRKLAHCDTTNYLNWWDKKLTFRVPAAHFLTGVYSIHHNHYEDRRWKFQTCFGRSHCKLPPTTTSMRCQLKVLYVYIYQRKTLLQTECTTTFNLHTSMITTGFLLLSLVSFVTSYVNDFDKPVVFQCPRGQSIVSWESYHSNYHEDRRHSFTCQRTPKLGKCQWSGYVNDFDKPISYQCPNNGVISGVISFHSNHHEDRRFKFYCCSVRHRHLVHCGTTDYLNWWDKKLTFRVPAAHFLKGVYSIHHNHYEDRRWKFQTCLLH
ncbi:uncharacterized protein [Haliotis asinina]|uniref:uncharacterized protein n=1 Tax=Haliotis asinina TaxID=109174 RepID=UPI00353231E1